MESRFVRVAVRLGAGFTLLAVVLEDQIKATAPRALDYTGGAVEPLPAAVREQVATPLGQAFARTFWWAVGLTALAPDHRLDGFDAIIVACLIIDPQRRMRRALGGFGKGDFGRMVRDDFDRPAAERGA